MKNTRKWGVNPNLNPDWPAIDEEHECHIAEQYISMWVAGLVWLCRFLR